MNGVLIGVDECLHTEGEGEEAFPVAPQLQVWVQKSG
jgi:hypothetical protein